MGNFFAIKRTILVTEAENFKLKKKNKISSNKNKNH